MTDEDSILIGEGVVLDSGAAPVPLRMVSGAIDMVATLMLLVAGFAALDNLLPAVNDAWQRAIVIAWTVVGLVVVPVLVETLSRGRSLGRWAMGLRVVRDDGGPVSARHATARALLAVLEVYGTAGMLAVTVSALGSRGKRIGDYVAGTYAMRTRGAKRALPTLAMPVGLGEWARTADITRLPDGLALTARMFLARVDSIHPRRACASARCCRSRSRRTSLPHRRRAPTPRPSWSRCWSSDATASGGSRAPAWRARRARVRR
ncbi:hypothetical protein GCM10025873_28010 [Demequina sediminis]|uniref:RDD family protein n=1 Tax=Demequina sediminis TaxID=1930058 RepID=UPI002572716E|nr:RDD family protein [Demequina sediminis]BDZ60232.1 hypothetical protein GCM10025873_00230 [Demequina sediminis]BDZ63010.1 hypothetical protein GCM10025873_28010 [Demequina sediminis]